MNRVQTLRSSVAGNRPAAGTRAPGELWLNWPDSAFGCIDAAQNAQDLVPVRWFSTFAGYAIGDYVMEQGTTHLYRCINPTGPGVFVPADWSQVLSSANASGLYLPLAGGTMTGPIVLSADAAAALNPVSLQQLQAGYLPLAGGTTTGAITLPGNPVGVLDAAPKQYVDTQNALSVQKTGDTMTGPLVGTVATFNGGTAALNASGATPVVAAPNANTPNLILNKSGSGFGADITAYSNGVARWQVILGGATAESGGNAGSDFAIANFSDAGAPIGDPFTINRATSAVAVNGNGAAAYLAAVTTGNATLAMNKTAATNACNIYGTLNGTPRWIMQMPAGQAETGGNAGSNWALVSCNDAGAAIAAVMSAVRSTGVVTFSQAIVNGSDRRLKENISPFEGALAKVEQLQGVNYTAIGNDKPHVGLIAQDVQPVLPEVVFETGQPLDAQGKETEGDPMLGISYGNIVAVLIEAVKELSAKVTALEAA